MENAHLVGRRLPAEAEPEAISQRSPKLPFSEQDAWPNGVVVPRFGPHLPHEADARSQDLRVPVPAILLSEDLLPPPCHPCVLLEPVRKPSPFLSPAQSTPQQELEKSSPEERHCGGQGLRWQSSAGQGAGLGCVVRVRARRAIRVLLGPASQDQAVAQYLSQEGFSCWPPEAQD